MEYGVGLFPIDTPQEMLRLAERAEELGYGYLWFGDSHLIWREAYVNLGAAALRTTKAVLGTGVTNPLTRDPAVTAAAFATLRELAGDRVAVGIGLGDSSVETMSRKPATLAYLERAILTMRDLMAGKRVPVKGGEMHIVYGREGRGPIYVGARGPRMLRLAGKVADGCIILVGVAPEFLAAAMAEIEKGAREAGRDLAREGFRTVCWTPCSLGEDGQAARNFVKAHVARVLKRPLPFALGPEDQPVIQRIYAEYDYYEHMAVGTHHGDLVPDRLVEKFAIAGTAEECAEQAARIKAAGVDQLAIIPHTPNPKDRLGVLEAFASVAMR